LVQVVVVLLPRLLLVELRHLVEKPKLQRRKRKKRVRS
jgi:hypothetical protein